MIHYRFKTAFGGVDLHLRSRANDEVAELEWEGAEPAINLVRRELAMISGEEGRFLTGHATPEELAFAVAAPRLAKYCPSLVEEP